MAPTTFCSPPGSEALADLFSLARTLEGIVDAQGRIVALAPHASMERGATELQALALPGDAEALTALLASAASEGGIVGGCGVVHSDGTWAHYRIAPVGSGRFLVAVDRSLAHQAPLGAVGIALIAPDGRHFAVDAHYARLHDYDEATLADTPFTRLLDDPPSDQGWAAHEALLAGARESFSRIQRRLRRDGTPFTARILSAPLALRDASPLRLVVVSETPSGASRSGAPPQPDMLLRDITDRMPGAAYRLERSPDGHYRTVYMSERLRELAGLDPSTEIADFDTVLSMLPDADRRRALELAEASARDLTPYEQVFALDGLAGRRWIHARSQPHRFDDGTVVWNGLMLDITERKHAEDRLAQTEVELRDITTRIPGAIYRIERSPGGAYRATYMSEGLRELAGLSRDAELTDCAVIQGLLPADTRDTAFARAEESAQNLTPYEHIHPIDGPTGRRWVHVRSQPHAYEDGTVVWNGLMLDITGRKSAEEQLAEAQARLGQIAASLPGAIYQLRHETDGSYRFTYISDGLWRLGGFDLDEPLDDFATFMDLIPETERGELLAAIRASEQTLEPLQHAFRLVTPAGTFWVEARSVPTHLDDGSVVSNGLLFDVTERHEAQAEADRLKAIVESTPDLVVVTDTSGYILYLNAGGSRLLGLATSAAAVGRHFLDFLGEADAQRTREEIAPAAAREGSYSTEVTLVAVDGSEIPASQTTLCHRDFRGKATHFAAIVRDLTERIAAERELAASERRFRQLYNRTPVMLHETDPAGRITSVSDFWLERLGYARDEVLGQDSGAFFTADAQRRLAEYVRPHFWNHGYVRNASLELVRRDGQVLDVLLSADADEDDSGQSARCRAVMVDVSDQRRAEAGYREIFDNATEGIYRSTPGGRLLRANPALVQLQGFDSEDALVEAVTDIAAQWYVNAGDREHMQQLLARDGRVENFEAEVYRIATGERIWTSENVRAVYSNDGTLAYYEGTVRDITAAYRARRLAQRRGEILEMVARDAPLTGTLYEIVGALEQTYRRMTAAIFRLQEGRLYAAAAPGLSNACIRAVDGTPPSVMSGALGPAIQGNSAVLDEGIDGASGDPLARAARQSGYGAIIGVPINDQRGAALGVLAAFLQYPSEAGHDRVQLVTEMAQIASIAIEQYRLSQELIHRAQYDTLTELPNRALLADRLQQAVTEAERNGYPLAVLLLDLDEFKLVNDTLGHSAGDTLLGQVAERLRGCVRPGDTVARLGGDEFVIVAPLRRGDIGDLAERILATLQSNLYVAGREVTARPSLGIALYPEDGATPEALLQAADTAMYAAKHAGKNRFRFFSADMNAEMSERLRIEAELRNALDGGELELNYQPRFALDGGEIMGAEGLLRWHHPERGLLQPGEFLSIAERGPLMPAIDRCVLQAVARQTARWQQQGRPLVVSVNLSANELHTDGFAEDVARLLAEAGVDPDGLEIEITESMLMQDFARATRQLRDLKERAPGLRVAIDDFGSGYSSLNYLRHLPIDTLKVDRSFVADLVDGESGTAGAIIRTIVELGRNLGLTVVAEGVEGPQQVERLRALGCHHAQGFWYGPALPATDFDRRLAS